MRSPGVAQAGQDVALLVELAVDGGGVDRDLRVLGVQGLDAFGGGDEADELHVSCTPAFLRKDDRRRAAAAGREHRVDQQHFGVGDVGRKLLVVADRLERLLVAVDAQVTEAGVGEQAEDAVGHAQARRGGSARA